MSQIDKVIIATKQLFNQREQTIVLKKGGKENAISVTYKPKKKQAPSQKPAEVVKKPAAINIARKKNQKNKADKKVAVARPKSGKPKRGHAKCAKCGEIFSPAHKCPPGPRQPTYTTVKSPAVSRAKGREQDETKKPRITPFDKSTAGTTMRGTKLAGATKQGSKPADKPHAKRHNEKFIKVKKPVAVNATSIKGQQNKPNKNSRTEKVDVKPATTKSISKTKKAKKNSSLGIFNEIVEAYKLEAKKMSRTQLRQEIEKMQRRHKAHPSDVSNNVRLMNFKIVYERRPGAWPIRVRTTS